MSRWVWASICAILALVMLGCGLLVPVHLRAVDASVVNRAGRKTSSLAQEGLALLNDKKIGAAYLYFQAAGAGRVDGWGALGVAVTNFARTYPATLVWGGIELRLQKLFGSDPALARGVSEPFTAFVVREENREKVLEALGAKNRPIVRELLKCRALTNTVVFSPSQSDSGQALDAAVCLCGLLLEGDHLSSGLRDAVVQAALQANSGGDVEPLEEMLLNLLSLGQRLDWGQLVEFAGRIEDRETLRLLVGLVRRHEARLPVLFTAVVFSGRPEAVARYLMAYSQSGLDDLAWSLHCGVGGLKEVLRRQQRVFHSPFRQWVASYDPFGAFFQFTLDYCWLMPWFALILKWLFYLAAGFALGGAWHLARPALTALERPLLVPGFTAARGLLFALGLLLVVLLLSEPFLAQESQKVELPFRLRLPTVGSVGPAGTAREKSPIMNQLSLLTLLLFFVLQALLYTASLVKLAEIRRHHAPSRVKLRLLENEDHLFDAGLYLGFVGTIISLILVSLGVIKPSLMAAYSSTSFGIIFVSIFKIFHLRPLRRELVLETEAASVEPFPARATPTLVTPS